MTWRDEWFQIEARVASLREAAGFLASALKVQSEDPYGSMKKFLLPEAKSLFDSIQDFRGRYAQILPESAANALEDFSQHDALFTPGQSDPLGHLKIVVAALTAICGRVGYLIHESTEEIRSTVERAFVHLQYSLIADSDLRARWIAAFEKDEPACEALGAVHLLAHGIWAFKVHGPGQRTDLVLQEPLTESATVARAHAPFVLTEWKRVLTPGDAHAKRNEALRQATIYGREVLAALELGSTRYLALVSSDRLHDFDDETQDGVQYRTINIAVSAATPSKAARGKAAG